MFSSILSINNIWPRNPSKNELATAWWIIRDPVQSRGFPYQKHASDATIQRTTFRKYRAMTLSLRQAFAAKENEEISWDDYIHILLARCTALKHEDDNVEGTYPHLRYTDPLGHELWFLSKRMDPIEDTSALEDVFKAYRHSTLDDVKNKLALLDGMPEIVVETMKKSLALLACQDRRPDVLKYFLDLDDFPIEATLEDEADSVDPEKDPEDLQRFYWNLVHSSRLLVRRKASGSMQRPILTGAVGSPSIGNRGDQ